MKVKEKGENTSATSADVAALERSDNVADSSHAFAVLKRGYTRRAIIMLVAARAAQRGGINQAEMAAARTPRRPPPSVPRHSSGAVRRPRSSVFIL